VWDPWRDLGSHRDELAGSDIYTLRRIVPGDRGKTWPGDRK
jgi:3-oxoacyl-[acyl-carrier protein] reductase